MLQCPVEAITMVAQLAEAAEKWLRDLPIYHNLPLLFKENPSP